ncbi:type II toxin-antitoxin system PemK/MazF family toxin [Microcystis aeruginosa]
MKCEDVRSISVERLEKRWGTVSSETLALVEDRLRILMGLY